MEDVRVWRVYPPPNTDSRTLQKYGAYLAMARSMAALSHATRLKVGALLMREGRVLGSGYNGTVAGSDNACEMHGHTLPDVIHAEANAICFAARHGVSLEGATLVCTHAPCIHCAKLVVQAGVMEVCYGEEWETQDGLRFLERHGVVVWRYVSPEVFHLNTFGDDTD